MCSGPAAWALCWTLLFQKKIESRGIGRFLISGIIKSLALTDFYAETDEEAVGFYRSLGFTVTSLGDKYNSGSQRYLCQKRGGGLILRFPRDTIFS